MQKDYSSFFDPEDRSSMRDQWFSAAFKMQNNWDKSAEGSLFIPDGFWSLWNNSSYFEGYLEEFCKYGEFFFIDNCWVILRESANKVNFTITWGSVDYPCDFQLFCEITRLAASFYSVFYNLNFDLDSAIERISAFERKILTS